MRSLPLVLGVLVLVGTGFGCQEKHTPAADFRLKGYTPWTAPATDPLVDTWYLTVTPEEFDRYWLTPQSSSRP